MEKQALITAMKTSISEVLETMFFLPLEYASNTDPERCWSLEEDEILASKLNFSGPFSGHFVFLIPASLALSLSASFLGCDEELVTRDHVIETVKEIINMIAGSTFGNYDNSRVFNLDIPKIVSLGEFEKHGSDAGEVIFIAINTLENHLALRMVMTG